MKNIYYSLIILTQLLDGVLSMFALTSTKFSIYEANPIIVYLLSVSPYSIVVFKLLAGLTIIGFFIIMSKKLSHYKYHTVAFTICIFSVLLLGFIGVFTGIYTYIHYYIGGNLL